MPNNEYRSLSQLVTHDPIGFIGDFFILEAWTGFAKDTGPKLKLQKSAGMRGYSMEHKSFYLGLISFLSLT